MSGALNLQPMLTSTSPGLFGVSTDGVIQGFAMDDPAIRFLLTQGTIGGSLPMFGGMAISELIPVVTNPGNASPTVQPATGISSYMGFSVFNQSHALINSVGSPVPVGFQYQSINYYRKNSNARIAVKCAPSLISIDGGFINQQVSWDFNGQQLIPYVAAYAANVITAATYATGASTFTTTTAHGVVAGDYFTVTGFTPAGWNGTYIAQAGTTGSTLVGVLTPAPQTVTPGAVTTYGTLAAGGGALPIQGVLEVLVGNSKVINVDPTGTIFSWNNSGTAAVILI